MMLLEAAMLRIRRLAPP